MRVVAAVEELRDAVSELAALEMADRRRAIRDFSETARAKLSALETVAQKGIARLSGKG